MFLIVNDTKSFMKHEYSVTQSSVMIHPYKCAIADVFSEKNFLVKWTLVITNYEGAIGLCLI